MTTYQTIADTTRTTVPPHLEAQATPPLITSFGRQGDVYLRREAHPAQDPATGHPVTGTGHQVVAGEADRNSHILNSPNPDVRFHPGRFRSEFDYGLLVVPEGAECFLTHTAEHGSVAVGPGQWRVWGQVEYAEEIRRAAD